MSMPKHLTRRRFLQSLATMGAVGLGGVTYLWQVEPRWLTLQEHDLPIATLPTAFDGLRIVQLSDIHIDPLYRYGYVARVVERVNALEPDVVVLTGDYVTQDAGAAAPLAAMLAGLRAPLGTYAVLGNHDVWRSKRVAVRNGFVQAGIPMLENDHVVLARAGQTLVVAGLDDGWGGRPSLRQALDAAPDAPVILLLHEPDLVTRYQHEPRIVVQLSGHSHGGQVRIPGHGAIYLPRYAQQFDAGIYRVGNTWLNTNVGLGMTSYGITTPPVRFNCPPEISVLTLRRQNPETGVDSRSSYVAV
jgi:predicted MPP superfamily phosphohydrolase